MEGPKALHWLLLIAAIWFASTGTVIRAQISTPCTASMITSFTPCFNFITGSSGNGNSPTQECCNSFKSLMTTSMECTCLVITANVPIPIPINRSLAISLPRICKTGGVPIQCKASGSPLPPPGPVLFAPPPPTSPSTNNAAPPQVAALPGLSPRGSPAFPSAPKAAPPRSASLSPQSASKAVASPQLAPMANSPESDIPQDIAPADAPAEPTDTPKTPGIRPVLNPSSSDSNPSMISSIPALHLLIMSVGVLVLFRSYED